MADLYYALAPFVWDAVEGGFWRPADGVVGGVDLRVLGHMGPGAAGSDQPYGFFASTVPFGSEAVTLGHGDLRELSTDALMRSAWLSATGYQPSGATLCDLLFDHLTNGADPSGESASKPLVPTAQGVLELHLGGHSLIKAERFTRSHGHWPKLRDMLQRDFEAIYTDYANLPDARLRDVPLKVLGGLCEKYGLDLTKKADWIQLVPPKLRSEIVAPKKPETITSDTFNRADSGTLGTSSSGWSWNALVSTTTIVSNRCVVPVGSTNRYARAETDLSSSDNSAQADLVSIAGSNGQARLYFRYASGADSAYCYSTRNAGTTGQRLFKNVTGTFTQIGSDVSGAITGPNTIKGQASGSTIAGYLDGGLGISVTDTALSTGTRAGIGGLPSNGDVTLDNFVMADLAAAGTLLRHPGMDGGMKSMDGGLRG